MRRIQAAIIWVVTLLLVLTSYFKGRAASATVYVDPAGTCGGKTPCHQWISQALANVSNGGIVIVTRNTNDNIISPATAQNITIKGESPGITLTGGGGVNISANPVVGWTIEDLIFTGGFLIQDVVGTLTVRNISTTGMTLGYFTQDTTADITIANNGLSNADGSVISILAGAGFDVNGSIVIQDNSGVDAINVFANVTTGNPANLNADVTLDGNQTLRGANIGVDSSLLGGKGSGDVTGTIIVTNNTAGDGSGPLGDGKFGVTIANSAHGNITGPVTFSNNSSVWLAVLTIDSTLGGDISGSVTANGNDFEFIELNARGTFSSNVTVSGNNVVDKPGGVAQGPTIQVDGDPLSANVTIQNTTGAMAQIGVRSEVSPMTGLVRILNNSAGYITLDSRAGSITQPVEISGNVLPPGSPPYSAMTIKTVGGSLAGGTLSNNKLDVLQFDLDGVLSGALTVSGNLFREDASFYSHASSSGPGSATASGNDFQATSYFKSVTSIVKFNRHVGLMSVVQGTSVTAVNNWWGCDAGPGSAGCAPVPNSPSLVPTSPWLTVGAGATCTSPTSITVGFDVLRNSDGLSPAGNVTPGLVTVSTTVGSVSGSPANLVNGAGNAMVVVLLGSSPTITVQLDSASRALHPTCNPARESIGVFRPANGVLYLRNFNETGYAELSFTYGLSGDRFISGDWDNNNTDTVGNFRNGVFYLRNSNTTGYADITFGYGLPGDLPIAGDWDGDGIDTIGIFRSGVFYLRNSNTTGYADTMFGYGLPGDVPIAGDWDGDGVDTVGIFRNGVFYLRNSNTTGYADLTFSYGLPGDIPIGGDWNNDDVATAGTYRGGVVYLRNSNSSGYADVTFGYGIAGDQPLAGDWDGMP